MVKSTTLTLVYLQQASDIVILLHLFLVLADVAVCVFISNLVINVYFIYPVKSFIVIFFYLRLVVFQFTRYNFIYHYTFCFPSFFFPGVCTFKIV